MESEITISKGRESYSFIVRYEYYYQKEQWYDVHGDPGTPEIEEVELISIHTNEDLLLLMDNFKNWRELEDEIIEKIAEEHRKKGKW